MLNEIKRKISDTTYPGNKSWDLLYYEKTKPNNNTDTGGRRTQVKGRKNIFNRITKELQLKKINHSQEKTCNNNPRPTN